MVRGAWSCVWASRIIAWAGHIVRNTANPSWPQKILHVRSSRELNYLRSTQSQRPRTRAAAGWCCVRWTDGVSKAIDFLTSQKLKQESVSRMEFNSVMQFARNKRHFYPFACLEDSISLENIRASL